MSNRDKLITLQSQLGWNNNDIAEYLERSLFCIVNARTGKVKVKNHVIDALKFKLMEMNK